MNMKKLLLKLLIFSVLNLLLFSAFLIKYGGFVDYFYFKFTTPKQYSMIVGDSRALQDIQPKVLDSCLNKTDYKLPTYNFCFTMAQSAYGPSYLDAIKRKLNTNADNQLFILAVTPWSLANRHPELEEESDFFLEDAPPHNMRFMNINPNFEYIIKNYSYFHFKGVFRKNSILYKDGFLENNNLPEDEETFQKWKTNELNILTEKASEWDVSPYRLNWLSKTISYLNQYGTVFLVRLPVDPEMLLIENDFWESLTGDIERIAEEYDVEYLDFSNQNDWDTYDGHHLNKYAAAKFTSVLSERIIGQ